MLAIGGAGAAGLAAAGVAGAVMRGSAAETAGDTLQGAASSVDFYGRHQAGIITPAQDRLHFVAFDVITKRRDELVRVLKEWSAAAARMTAGRDAGETGAVGGIPEAPPDDTGEAIGLPASQLTLTIGFGASLFRDGQGRDRFGLADRLPEALQPLPRFLGDALRPEISGGDICVQACATTPGRRTRCATLPDRLRRGQCAVVAARYGHVVNVQRSRPPQPHGFKDGTANLKAEETAELDRHLWVAPGDGPSWLEGGAYVVTRKIRMMIETWDRTPLAEQETIFGRTKGEGAALGQVREFDEPDFHITHGDGEPVVPLEAHVRLAHPSSHGGAGCCAVAGNFVDGSDGLGRLDAGLFFIAFQRNAHQQFVPVQRQLASKDILNEYIRHVSSGLFACPPGVADSSDYWGRSLFA
jgi:deferrochelatase/peroxidase EfeB